MSEMWAQSPVSLLSDSAFLLSSSSTMVDPVERDFFLAQAGILSLICLLAQAKAFFKAQISCAERLGVLREIKTQAEKRQMIMERSGKTGSNVVYLRHDESDIISSNSPPKLWIPGIGICASVLQVFNLPTAMHLELFKIYLNSIFKVHILFTVLCYFGHTLCILL